jgi:hypothetical protein
MAAGAARRNTATFEAYYWEAYNEIVEPRLFDKYLVERWLPSLGPLAFALVKALRRRCYHNPKQGVTRNEVEIDIGDLARAVGVHKATVYRELERNEALGQFVRVQHQYVATDRSPKRCVPHFTVAMDDPVHPDDLERYEALRVQKERERAEAEAAASVGKPDGKFRVKGVPGQPVTPPKTKSQNATNGETKSQNATPESQNATPESQNATDAPIVSSSPSGGFTKDSVPATPDSPAQSAAPRGAEKGDSPEATLWRRALDLLACRVNKPTLEAHLRPLVLASVAEDGTALLLAPHAATRDWIEKRHLPVVAQALAEALDRPVTVQLRTVAAQAVTRSRHDGTGL